jgi:hypothetical protein
MWTVTSAFLSLTCACISPRPAADATAAAVEPAPDRDRAFRLAHIWKATPVEQMDIAAGPGGPGAFAFEADVTCTFVEKPLRGHSAKFACDLGGGDVVKVKFGEGNGEVYAEVAATRLLWALGFGADRMYPVRVTCRGCPARLGARARGETTRFDPAVIERELRGAGFDDDPGWSWDELDKIDAGAGGAPRAEIDALKLIAVFLQHTDNKVEQQRLICLDETAVKDARRCTQPFLVLDDLGLTFGAANFMNSNDVGGANFEAWAREPVWRDAEQCVGNLAPSFSGTLSHPRISEAGRAFLASLLNRLSRRQIRALFEVSRVHRRQLDELITTTQATVDDWVRVFDEKRDAISRVRCPE